MVSNSSPRTTKNAGDGKAFHKTGCGMTALRNQIKEGGSLTPLDVRSGLRRWDAVLHWRGAILQWLLLELLHDVSDAVDHAVQLVGPVHAGLLILHQLVDDVIAPGLCLLAQLGFLLLLHDLPLQPFYIILTLLDRA